MLFKLIVYFLGGKLLIYTIQNFPLTIKIKNINSFFHELISCDFCLGCWVYFLFGFWFPDIWFEGIKYVDILSPFFLGIGASFVMHLITLGWKTKFEVFIIDE